MSLVVATVVFALILIVLVPNPLGGAVWLPAALSFPTIPIAIAVAVLRYRLFEIDRLISRTISYATVTGILVFVFSGVILLLQGLLTGLHPGPDDRRGSVDPGRFRALPARPQTASAARSTGGSIALDTTPSGQLWRSPDGSGTRPTWVPSRRTSTERPVPLSHRGQRPSGSAGGSMRTGDGPAQRPRCRETVPVAPLSSASRIRRNEPGADRRSVTISGRHETTVTAT